MVFMVTETGLTRIHSVGLCGSAESDRVVTHIRIPEPSGNRQLAIIFCIIAELRFLHT